MSPKDEEKPWKEFERELRKAIAKDQAMTKQEYQAWLDTLPEYVPAGTGNTVKVIFLGTGKRSPDKHRDEQKSKKRKLLRPRGTEGLSESSGKSYRS